MRYSSLAAFEELKYFDSQLNWVATTGGNESTLGLALPNQGQTATTRIGQKIMVKSLDCDFTIRPDYSPAASSANAVPSIVYVMIAVDRDHNSAVQPAITEVYSLSNNAPGAFRNLDNTSKYRVLMFKQLIINPLAVMTNNEAAGSETYSITFPCVSVHYYKKFKDAILVQWVAGTATSLVGNTDRNYIWASVFNQSSTVGSTTVYTSIRGRCRYVD